MRADGINTDRAMALADCNNFFASCERRADPSLAERPIVVLSCNDGCVVARSNEVKKLGVKMGEPYFRIKNTLAHYGVAVRSSNMPLYREVSAEVMERIKLYTDASEQYSIDECFFNMRIASVADPVSYCRAIRDDVRRRCRVPVSIGIAPTKTLCKLAAEYAKHHDESGGVFWMDGARYRDEAFMSQFECGDVWGIGGKTAKDLALRGVRTAADLVRQDELTVKKRYGVRLLFTLWELKGQPASGVDTAQRVQKSIMVSRSFGSALRTYDELLDPLLCFTAAAGRQLRKIGRGAGRLAVWIMTSPFAERRYYNTAETSFQSPRRLDGELMPAAASTMKKIYSEGYEYKKCGVMLSCLTDISSGSQNTLFEDESAARRARLAAAVDALNSELGRGAVKPAILFPSPGTEKPWAPRSEFHSAKGGIRSPLPDGVRFQSHAEDLLS